MKQLILVLVALLLVAPATADEPDRAEELTRRTYCLHTVSNDLLATGTSYGLVLYRLNDRGFPTRAGALKMEDAVTALASKGSLVFAGNGPRGLVVVDVSDADDPKEVVRLETPGAVLRLLRDDKTLFAAMGTMGLGIIDIEQPRAPVLERRLETPGATRDLSHGPDGGLMVAAEVLNWARRPKTPISYFDPTGIPQPGAVGYQRRTLVAVGGALHKVDARGFAGPGAQPLLFEDDIRDIEVFLGGVAVAASSDGLVLLEFSGLSNRIASRLDPGGACTRVHVRGSLLFATADAYGFAVYNIKDLDKPVKIYPADVPEK